MENELKALRDALEILTERVDIIEQRLLTRNRATPLQRAMTEDDARKILDPNNDHIGHKELAAQLGLEYGQVYACRKGHTSKKVRHELATGDAPRSKWL